MKNHESQRRIRQITEDAVALRGIADYLQKSTEPIPTPELAICHHLGDPSALRLCRLLQKAGYIEHPIVTRIIDSVPTKVPQRGWQLVEEFECNGCVFDAEKLARGA